MKKFHVTFLIWGGEVVIGSLKWHGEVTKIGVIKRYHQQCPTTDDKKRLGQSKLYMTTLKGHRWR
jgi:hypothetical protein